MNVPENFLYTPAWTIPRTRMTAASRPCQLCSVSLPYCRERMSIARSKEHQADVR